MTGIMIMLLVSALMIIMQGRFKTVEADTNFKLLAIVLWTIGLVIAIGGFIGDVTVTLFTPWV